LSLAYFSTRRPVTIIMIFLAIVLMGLIALGQLRQELFPPITFPEVTIVTNYFNAAPEEIETLVTKPIEEAVSSVNGLKSIRSISQEGKSIIRVGFDWGVAVDFAALAVREKIDFVKDRLPRDAEDPVVIKFDPLSRPVLLLSLTGKPSLVDLKEIALTTVKDVIEKVEGVASVSVSGGLDREILIEVDQGRLFASGLSILALVESLERTNLSYPAGSIKKGLYEHLIRTIGEFDTVEDIAFSVAGTDRSDRIYIPEGGFVERAKFGPRDTLESKRLEAEKERPKKRLILFKDVALVRDTIREPESISRYNGKKNVSLAIQKQAGANSLRVSRGVREALKKIEDELVIREVDLEIIFDQSIFIREAIAGVRDAAWQGSVLAFIVLLFFLRNIRTALIVTLAIPISIIGVFFLMYLRGITINIMSLGGLALGAGMLVDNGIVVIENIFRHREQGMEARQAAVRGANEVIWPVFSSTLTTIAVFFPLILFVPGVPGQIFGDLSWTVIMAIVMSLLVSSTLVPMLAVHVKTKKPDKVSSAGGSFWATLHQRPRSVNNLMAFSLLGVAAIFLVSMLLMMRLDQEVLPKIDQGEFLVNVELPIGGRLEGTDEIMKTIEHVLMKMPDIKNIAVSIGSAKSESDVGVVQIETRGSHQGQILVTLKDDRERSSVEVVDAVRIQLSKKNLGWATVEFVVQESEFQAVGGAVQPIQIEVKGYDLDILGELVGTTKSSMVKIAGVFNVGDDQAKASPETKIIIDKRKAALFGISALDIAITARTAIDGDIATKFREKGKEIDIRVRLREEDRKNFEALNNLLVHSEPFEIEVPIKDLAKITQGLGPSEIRHRNQERTVMVQAEILPDYVKKDVLAQAQEVVQRIKVPEGFSISLVGEAEEIRESFSRIIFALLLSVLLTYMIMAAQFESFLHPLVIMFTVPLSLIGVGFALFVTNTTLNVISLLGIVMLGGIVVNNGIILVEYINVARRDGVPLVEACIQSATVRARPILMSALTTVVGLIPLALGLGKGAELRAPLAIAVMGGLLSATFLTILTIPCIYIIFERASAMLSGKKVA